MDCKQLVGVIVMAVLAPAMAYAQAAPAPAGKGAAIFAAQKCSMCHSLEGKGQVKGPLDDVGSKLTAEEIRLWIVDPVDMTRKTSGAIRKPAMRAYPNLSKDDLSALVAFLVTKKSGPPTKVVQTKP